MPREIVTEKGSVYRYLPDGRTQRYKAATKQLRRPKELIVFVPDFDYVRKNAPQEYRRLFVNETSYLNLLLAYVHLDDKKCYVIDKNGKKLNTNSDVKQAKKAYMAFMSGLHVDFHIPVFGEPRIGFYVFDTHREHTENGYYRRHHLGHKVVEIR